MSDYRYPFITAKDPLGKIEQIASYLRQLVDQMNMEGQQSRTSVQSGFTVATQRTGGSTESAATFDEIKSLIIKSADIVDALYESYSKKLEGVYVAQSQFGTYTEKSEAEYIATAKQLEAILENVQIIESSTGEFQNATIQQLAEIKAQANQLYISVETIENNGVSQVKTKTGYTFADDGVHIQKEGSDIENKIDHTGMYVSRSDENILQATADGVKSIDITVKNYLKIPYSRFEQYTDGNDSKRTACFHTEEG